MELFFLEKNIASPMSVENEVNGKSYIAPNYENLIEKIKLQRQLEKHQSRPSNNPRT